MLKEWDLNYVLEIKDSGVIDLALGMEDVKEDKKRKIRCGIDNHTMSFVVDKVILETDTQLTIESGSTQVDFKLITVKEYEQYRGRLFSENVPKITDDDEVQEFITSSRFF